MSSRFMNSGGGIFFDASAPTSTSSVDTLMYCCSRGLIRSFAVT
jgi:hypothetical protein